MGTSNCRRWRMPVLAVVAATLVWTGPALAGSFTFDYQHPTGAGSSFADTIPLATVGSVADSNGATLGFTKLGNGTTNGLTLDPGGLTFMTGVGGATLGIPAPTDGTGNVRITARFSGSTEGWDADYELISIGWGPDDTFNINDLLQAIAFHNSGTGGDSIVMQARLADGTQVSDPTATPNIEQLSVSAPAAAGSLTTAVFIGDGGSVVASAAINDGYGLNSYRLGQADSYAWLILGGGIGRGTLTSITIEGPNVTAPDVDSDGDGVLDDVDICPGGDDAIDNDFDAVPDFCDACPLDPENDADGDGYCADVDSCPGGDDDVNSDGEGLPDFCDICPFDPENDADADGICESEDNCPVIANADQSDLDSDEMGDVCDDDMDGDGVLNQDDNCPFDVNLDQVDTDGDAAGDVCDQDLDGDDVLDAMDACVPSPVGVVVNADGCAVSELCPCEHSNGLDRWKNHGAYVSCVAHVTNDFFAATLITEEERSLIQSAAGASTCGQKNN